MLRAIFGLLLICFTSSTFSQHKKGPFLPVTKEDYLILSKREKTAAWILFGTGSTMVLVAALIGKRKDNSETAFILGGLGAPSVGASIPLFILSGKHRKRAMRFEMLP
jgi:hypothetical protein